MSKIDDLKDVFDWIEGNHPDCHYDPLESLRSVMAALESEEMVAEGLADPDALADYDAGRQHMLTIFKVRALHTDKPVRIVAVEEE